MSNKKVIMLWWQWLRKLIKQVELLLKRVEKPDWSCKLWVYLCTNVYNCMIFFPITVRSWVIGTENVKSSRNQVSYFPGIITYCQNSSIYYEVRGFQSLRMKPVLWCVFTNAQGLRKELIKCYHERVNVLHQVSNFLLVLRHSRESDLMCFQLSW